MKNYLLISIFVLFVTILFLGFYAQSISADKRAEDETPIVRRVKELINIINSSDLPTAKTYVESNYSKTFGGGEIPLGRHLEFIGRIHDLTQGLIVLDIKEHTSVNATARLRSKLTDEQFLLTISVDAQSPHLINSIRLVPDSAAKAQPVTAKNDAEKIKELESFLDKLTQADLFSGAVLLAKDNQILFKRAYGEANKDFNVPNREDTKFNLGSMNKMFTAVAIAQLVERGKLSFEDPLAKYLPDFPNKQDAQKIKIKHLLTHSSGLGSYFGNKFRQSSRELYRTVDEMMNLAEDKAVAFEPGTRWSYSNTGFLVLGAVIEKVTGQSYFDYIRDNIYKPAGMINTDCYELDSVVPNLAVGYDKAYSENGRQIKNNIFRHVMRGGPAGGGYSTVEDLFRFAAALRSNKLLNQESLKLVLSPKPELNAPDYGYGFSIDSEQQIVGHSGGFFGISSNLDIYLNNGYTAVVMSNYGGGSQPVNKKLRALLATK